jgi:hypothetical protein
MAEVLTAEQSARRILKLLLDNGAKAGDSSLTNQLSNRFITSGGAADDFRAGIQFAGRNGWITNYVILTEAGLDEAGSGPKG